MTGSREKEKGQRKQSVELSAAMRGTIATVQWRHPMERGRASERAITWGDPELLWYTLQVASGRIRLSRSCFL